MQVIENKLKSKKKGFNFRIESKMVVEEEAKEHAERYLHIDCEQKKIVDNKVKLKSQLEQMDEQFANFEKDKKKFVKTYQEARKLLIAKADFVVQDWKKSNEFITIEEEGKINMATEESINGRQRHFLFGKLQADVPYKLIEEYLDENGFKVNKVLK